MLLDFGEPDGQLKMISIIEDVFWYWKGLPSRLHAERFVIGDDWWPIQPPSSGPTSSQNDPQRWKSRPLHQTDEHWPPKLFQLKMILNYSALLAALLHADLMVSQLYFMQISRSANSPSNDYFLHGLQICCMEFRTPEMISNWHGIATCVVGMHCRSIMFT